MTAKKRGRPKKQGRPTTYQKAYGDLILKCMEEGLSQTAAAAEINVAKQRLTQWKKVHPDLADQIKVGESKRQAFLERRLLKADTSPIVNSSIFALRNAAPDDWADRKEHVHKGSVEIGVDTNTRQLARAVLELLGQGVTIEGELAETVGIQGISGDLSESEAQGSSPGPKCDVPSTITP